MNIQKALEFTKDRIESISASIYTKESERKIADETLEYLKFIKHILENLKD